MGLVGRSVDASEQNDSNLPFCTGWNVVLLAGILRPVFFNVTLAKVLRFARRHPRVSLEAYIVRRPRARGSLPLKTIR